MINILFVCTGNTCRSPMAEFIMKKKIKAAGRFCSKFHLSSAGISAADGDKMSANALAVLRAHRVRTYAFSSRRLTPELLKKNNLIVTMTEAHRRTLAGYPDVYSFAQLTGCSDIPDPYGGDEAVYNAAFNAISRACDILLGRIMERLK